MEKDEFKKFKFYIQSTYLSKSIFLDIIDASEDQELINLWLLTMQEVGRAKDILQLQILSQVFRGILKKLGVYTKEDGNYDIVDYFTKNPQREFKYYPFLPE